MMIPLYVVSCTSSISANAPEQAVVYDHLKSNINIPLTLIVNYHSFFSSVTQKLKK